MMFRTESILVSHSICAKMLIGETAMRVQEMRPWSMRQSNDISTFPVGDWCQKHVLNERYAYFENTVTTTC